MQVILDSSFAHPGSAPIRGGKKGEFRDWTNYLRVCHREKQMDVTFSCVCPIIDNKFLHNNVKVVCRSPRGTADYFDNVTAKFIVYNRTDA